MQGQQEPKLLALVGLTLANLRSPLCAVILEDDSPCSPGLGKQMLPGVTPFPIWKGRITPSKPVSWHTGNPAWRDPIAYLVHHHPHFQYPLSGLVSSQSFLYFTFLRFNYVIRTTGIRIWSARIHISNCYQQRKWAQHAHARVDVGCSPQSTHGYL